ncbi:MAG TPA: hypothetical protein VFH95_04640, partial [Candidatus Kapabacteria bacterium]|nr:hypothetical protein [Candidatus Kapabacteria bacterium]
MHKIINSAKSQTVIPAKAGIQILSLALIVALCGCSNSRNSTENSSMDISLDSLNHIYFPGSGGRPASAEEDLTWRWDVKTMRDDTGNNWQSRYGMPYQRNFTIRELLEFNPEKELEEDTGTFIPVGKITAKTPRLWGETYLHEYQIINVEARVVGYKFENYDKDIHLILSDTEGNTLIAEVPNWNEVGPWAKPYVEAVTKKLVEYFDRPTTKLKTPREIGPVFVV